MKKDNKSVSGLLGALSLSLLSVGLVLNPGQALAGSGFSGEYSNRQAAADAERAEARAQVNLQALVQRLIVEMRTYSATFQLNWGNVDRCGQSSICFTIADDLNTVNVVEPSRVATATIVPLDGGTYGITLSIGDEMSSYQGNGLTTAEVTPEAIFEALQGADASDTGATSAAPTEEGAQAQEPEESAGE